MGVVGPVWDRFIGPSGLQANLPEIEGRALATMDTTQASLVSFATETPEGVKTDVVVIPSTDFAFASCTAANPFPGTPSATQLCIKGGFNNQRGYELVRLARHLYILGVGEAAMRDVTSFFRYAAADDFGFVNPLASRIQYVLNFGNSQSGRLGKHFLNNGFNEDDSGTVGRIVLDGMNPNIAGMMGSFNIRFAKPGDIAEMYDPGANGTLWWGRLPGPGARHCGMGISTSLPPHQHLPEGHGKPMAGRSSGTAMERQASPARSVIKTFRCQPMSGATGTAGRRMAAAMATGTSAPSQPTRADFPAIRMVQTLQTVRCTSP